MLTIQQAIYGYLIFSVCMLGALFMNPKEVSAQFSRKSRYLPLISVLIGILVIYFQTVYSDYKKNFNNLPDTIAKDTLEYVVWQKDRHKLERDLYLSFSVILSQAFLLVASHWIHKYNTFIEYVERQKKAE